MNNYFNVLAKQGGTTSNFVPEVRKASGFFYLTSKKGVFNFEDHYITDITLREEAHRIDNALSFKEKIEIAKQLDKFTGGCY